MLTIGFFANRQPLKFSEIEVRDYYWLSGVIFQKVSVDEFIFFDSYNGFSAPTKINLDADNFKPNRYKLTPKEILLCLM